MPARPVPPQATAPMPVIIPLSPPGPNGDDRPEPRLTFRIEIPPTAEVLDLEMRWYPPMHAADLKARPGEWRIEGIGGWAALVTLRRRVASTSAAASSPRVRP